MRGQYPAKNWGQFGRNLQDNLQQPKVNSQLLQFNLQQPKVNLQPLQVNLQPPKVNL